MENKVEQLSQIVKNLQIANTDLVQSATGDRGPLLELLFVAFSLLDSHCSEEKLSDWEKKDGFTFALFLQELLETFDQQSELLFRLNTVIDSDYVLDEVRRHRAKHTSDLEKVQTRFTGIREESQASQRFMLEAQAKLESLQLEEAKMRERNAKRHDIEQRIRELEAIRAEFESGDMERLEEDHRRLVDDFEPIEARKEQLIHEKNDLTLALKKAEAEIETLLVQNSILDTNNAVRKSVVNRLKTRNDEIHKELNGEVEGLLIRIGENENVGQSVAADKSLPGLLQDAHALQSQIEDLLKKAVANKVT